MPHKEGTVRRIQGIIRSMLVPLLLLVSCSLASPAILTDANSSIEIRPGPDYSSPKAKTHLRESAEAGDTKAQATLAELLYSGQAGVDKAPVQAYKWAFVASLRGHRDAKYLLAEFDLFMSSEDRLRGRALAEQYLADSIKRQGESQDSKGSSDTNAQDAAHEPPPVAAVRDTSEPMNTNTQSEAAADNGRR